MSQQADTIRALMGLIYQDQSAKALQICQQLKKSNNEMAVNILYNHALGLFLENKDEQLIALVMSDEFGRDHLTKYIDSKIKGKSFDDVAPLAEKMYPVAEKKNELRAIYVKAIDAAFKSHNYESVASFIKSLAGINENILILQAYYSRAIREILTSSNFGLWEYLVFYSEGTFVETKKKETRQLVFEALKRALIVERNDQDFKVDHYAMNCLHNYYSHLAVSDIEYSAFLILFYSLSIEESSWQLSEEELQTLDIHFIETSPEAKIKIHDLSIKFYYELAENDDLELAETFLESYSKWNTITEELSKVVKIRCAILRAIKEAYDERFGLTTQEPSSLFLCSEQSREICLNIASKQISIDKFFEALVLITALRQHAEIQEKLVPLVQKLNERGIEFEI